MTIRIRLFLLMCAVMGAFIGGLIFIRYQQTKGLNFVLQTREEELDDLLNTLVDAWEDPLSLLSDYYARCGQVALSPNAQRRMDVQTDVEQLLRSFGAHALWVFRNNCQPLLFANVGAGDTLTRDDLPQEAIRRHLNDRKSLRYYFKSRVGIMEVWSSSLPKAETSASSADSGGLVVVGRLITPGFLQKVAQVTGGEVSLVQEGDVASLPSRVSDSTGRLTVRRRMLDWQGNTIAALQIELVSPVIETIVMMMKWGFLARILFTAICLLAVAWVLTRWLLVPLRRISASLDAKAVSLIRPLLKDPTEFGHISRMIAEFFQQQEELIKEAVERGRVEQALRESEQEFRAITMSVQDAIIMIDETGLVSFWNPAARRMFGFGEEEILGRTFEELLVPSGSVGWFDVLSKYWHPGDEAPTGKAMFELELLCKGGDSVNAEMALSPAIIGDRRYVLAVARDIGERKRAARTIAEQRMKMINASRLSSLGVMASGVAHEINNPLAIISVATQQLERMLMSDGKDHERIPVLIGNISRNITRIEGIIRGLRNLSRDGASDPFQKTSVKAIISDTLELCRARFLNHDVSLDLPSVPEALEVECRPVQISQVLLNLLNNAYDAVEQSEQKWVRIDVSKNDGSVEIRVMDSGPGIPRDLLDKVLEPFFTTKDVGRGMGLGLSVSKAIVDDHRGELSVETVDESTCFMVRIPEGQARRADVAPEFPPESAPKTLLLPNEE